MKKTLFTIIYLLPFFVFAQKLLKPQVDKISGDTTWSTSEEKLYFHGNYLTAQGSAVVFRIVRFGGSKSKVLVLHPQTLNQRAELSIARDQKAYLKLDDNSTIILSSATNDLGDTKFGRAGGNTMVNASATGYYDLSEADIEKLENTNLIFLRIEILTGNFDCDIKPKNAMALKKALALIEDIK